MKTQHFLTEAAYSESTALRPLALSYSRVSRLIQADGDGLRRQKDSFDEAQERYGVRIASEHQMIDMGLSAYKGKNLESGALGVLLKEAQAGKFPFGTILFVEDLDRLSRAAIEDALQLLLAIIKTGLVVVTTIDWQEYRTGKMTLQTLMRSIMKMELAHEESAKKAFRTKQSYANRYAKAEATGVLPSGSLFGWMKQDPITKKPVFHSEQRRSLVELICDMSLAGCGYPKIAITLNKANEEPFTKAKRNSAANHWTVAALENILKNPALYGDYHRKDGTMMVGIFPPVISKETFYRIQAGMASRLKVGRGRKGDTYTNLFGGIAKCHYCGGPMTHRPPKPGRAPQFYCHAMLVGKCDARPWSYKIFETAFLSFVNEIDLQTIVNGGSGSKVDEITQGLQSLEGERLNTQKAQDAFIEMIKKNPVLAPSFTTAMVDNQTKLDAINEQVKVLEAERNTIRAGHTAAKEANPVEFPSVGTDPGEVTVEKLYQLRAKTAEHIRTIVELVMLKRDPESKFGAQFTVEFKGGGMRTVHVDYTNPRKPYAITNDDESSQPNVQPEDKQTALELMKYEIANIARETLLAIENGELDAAKEMLDGVQEFERTIRQRADSC